MNYEEAERVVQLAYDKDPSAAVWLINEYGGRLEACETIGYIFTFSETPHGFDFWYEICIEVFDKIT